MTATGSEVSLQTRALITAALHPDHVAVSLIEEAAAGDHFGTALSLVDFVVRHTCVSPDVGEPADMLVFVTTAVLQVLEKAAEVLSLDFATYHRGILSASSVEGDPTLPAAQALLAAGLVSDELLRAVIRRAEPGAHSVIESLADVCVTAYADAAQTDPETLLTVLLAAAVGIIQGIADMVGCPSDSVVAAYWEQLVLGEGQQ